MDNKQNSLAILIDADNSQPRIIDGLLGEIASHGVASVNVSMGIGHHNNSQVGKLFF